MSVLETGAQMVLKGIVDEADYKPRRVAADYIFTLIGMGFVADEFRATERGAMYAVVHCNASFLKFLDKYPGLRPKWEATIENVTENLGKDADAWFRVVAETYLQLNLFNQYNYCLGGQDLFNEGRLQDLNLTMLYNGLQKKAFDEEKLIKMFMPPEMRGMLGKTASVEEVKALLLSQLPGITGATSGMRNGT